MLEHATTTQLAAGTRLGPVELVVTDLARSVLFYESAIGLTQRRLADRVAVMGAGDEDLLVLHEHRRARPARRHAGLYHFALLQPTRLELARAAKRLAETRTPISGASDHGLSDAIYLPDPDGNGVELAADRPREEWPDLSAPDLWAGGPEPLDLRGLLAVVAGEPVHSEADPRLTLGHVHLHVGDLDEATPFYAGVLGFDVMIRLPTAVFVAAGGYHHHVGLNTWRGPGVPPAPPDAVGLRRYTVLLESADEAAAVHARLVEFGVDHEHDDAGDMLVRDPAGNALALRTGT